LRGGPGSGNFFPAGQPLKWGETKTPRLPTAIPGAQFLSRTGPLSFRAPDPPPHGPGKHRFIGRGWEQGGKKNTKKKKNTPGPRPTGLVIFGTGGPSGATVCFPVDVSHFGAGGENKKNTHNPPVWDVSKEIYPGWGALHRPTEGFSNRGERGPHKKSLLGPLNGWGGMNSAADFFCCLSGPRPGGGTKRHLF